LPGVKGIGKGIRSQQNSERNHTFLFWTEKKKKERACEIERKFHQRDDPLYRKFPDKRGMFHRVSRGGGQFSQGVP
jgi:hypothetical protein